MSQPDSYCFVTKYQVKSLVNKLCIGPAKVKTFSGPCYMIKRVLTFVSGVQESVLVNFISQNFA